MISDPEELKQSWMEFVMKEKSGHDIKMEKWQTFLEMIREPLEKIKSIYSNLDAIVDDSNDDEF